MYKVIYIFAFTLKNKSSFDFPSSTLPFRFVNFVALNLDVDFKDYCDAGDSDRGDEEDDEKLIVVRKLKLIRFLYINIIINY